MWKPLSCAMLFACCGVSLAAEPPIPLPPESRAIETAPVGSTRVPTPAVPPAVSAADTLLLPASPAAVPYCPTAVDWGVRYRPEAVVPPANDGLHVRYPYYSYRRPWYPAGPQSINVTIIW